MAKQKLLSGTNILTTLKAIVVNIIAGIIPFFIMLLLVILGAGVVVMFLFLILILIGYLFLWGWLAYKLWRWK